MRALLYCVFGCPGAPPELELRGVDGHRVHVLKGDGLCAASSGVEPEPLATLERVKAYERVVAALFTERTVVPMRFGSLLDEAQVARFLSERQEHFQTLLQSVDGCAEMGVRVLEPPAGPRPAPPRAPALSSAGPGRAYLTALRERYGQPEQLWQGDFIARCRQALEGLYVQWKAEGPLVALNVQAGERGLQVAAMDEASRARGRATGAGLLSLFFLVPRRSVQAFQQAFHRLSSLETAVLSLSGPWPPYNFVTP